MVSELFSFGNHTPRPQAWKTRVWFGLGVNSIFTNNFLLHKNIKKVVGFFKLENSSNETEESRHFFGL